MKSNKFFYLFLFACIIILFIPNLLQRGMFVDGLWYAAISNNMANGLGTFWSPFFTKTMFPVFNEHPPLVFGIQSLFFKLLGNAMYVEKIYSLLIILATMWLIQSIWKQLFYKNDDKRELGYVPCLLWLFHESVYIYYPNNLLECTQGIFILLSILFILKGLHSTNNKALIYLSASGVFLLFSFLSKGFTGLFPLIMVPVYYFVYKSIPIKKAIIYSSVVFLSFIFLCFLLILKDAAFENIKAYLNSQVIAALNGHRTENVQSNRFYILKRLAEISILPLVIVTIISIISYSRKDIRKLLTYKKDILFFLFLGLSAVIPIMISTKQATYYLLTAIPCFSIAMGLLIAGKSDFFDRLKSSKTFNFLTISFLLTAIVFSFFKLNTTNKRDKVLIHDIDAIRVNIENGSTIGCKTQGKELALYGYFMRLNFISLDTISPFANSFVIIDSRTTAVPENYKKVDLNTFKFNLYKKAVKTECP